MTTLYKSVIVVVAIILIVFVYFFFIEVPQTDVPQTTGNVPQVLTLTADVYPLYSALTWGAAHTVTHETHTGVEVTSEPIMNITDLSAPSLPFSMYYKDKLAAAGWVVDNSLAAGGPGSEQIAYTKLNELILLRYTTVFKGGAANEPVQCPCDMTFSIFSGIH